MKPAPARSTLILIQIYRITKGSGFQALFHRFYGERPLFSDRVDFSRGIWYNGENPADRGVLLTFSKIDCLVNNAGISLVGLFTDATVDDWNLMINTNLTSVFTTCKNIVPHMLHHHEGKIINISSIWGDAGASCEVLYSTTKGGINAFTKALAKEVAASNIQVNAIAFGMIDTEMNAEFDEEDLALIKEEIPADYIASPKEAAQMVYHVATSPAYMTGQVITFSGGWY